MYAEKASLFSSRSEPLSLLFALLNFRLSSGVCVFCNLALALRFCVTSCLICDVRYCAFVGRILIGVAVFTACCRMSMISEDAVSMSSWVLSFNLLVSLSRTNNLYWFQSVRVVWSLVAGTWVAIVVLIVSMVGVGRTRGRSSVWCPCMRRRYLT